MFLDVLKARTSAAGVADKIGTLENSIGDLPFAPGEFDVLWSEGAIYTIGFAEGVGEWRRYLKPGGILVVSEITWLTDVRPAELQEHSNRDEARAVVEAE